MELEVSAVSLVTNGEPVSKICLLPLKCVRVYGGKAESFCINFYYSRTSKLRKIPDLHKRGSRENGIGS